MLGYVTFRVDVYGGAAWLLLDLLLAELVVALLDKAEDMVAVGTGSCADSSLGWVFFGNGFVCHRGIGGFTCSTVFEHCEGLGTYVV